MATECSKTLAYRDDIEALIAEIDACLPDVAEARDREHELQRLAYRERRTQARGLFHRLAASGGAHWTTLDGDAQRAREALRLSLQFFRQLV